MHIDSALSHRSGKVGLYGDIVLCRIKEIDLRMLDPEIMHIVRIV